MGRFHHDQTGGAAAALDQIARAEAARFLVHHRVQLEPSVQLHPAEPDGARHRDGGGQTRLHVHRAAPVQLAFADLAPKRRHAPFAAVAHRHHIDMAAQDQAAQILARHRGKQVGPAGKHLGGLGAHPEPVQHRAQIVLQVGFVVQRRIGLEFRVDRGDANQLLGQVDQKCLTAAQFGNHGLNGRDHVATAAATAAASVPPHASAPASVPIRSCRTSNNAVGMPRQSPCHGTV